MKTWVISAGLCLAAGPAMAQDAELGRENFLHYCATCHGLEARGNGPMAPVLTLQPVDLTQLAGRSGGEFPIFDVVARIDGRNPLVAHGSPMPVYGDFFEGKGVTIRDETGSLVMTSQPIVDLVAYLESIQE